MEDEGERWTGGKYKLQHPCRIDHQGGKRVHERQKEEQNNDTLTSGHARV